MLLKDTQMGLCSGRRAIPSDTRLAVCLCMLSWDSYLACLQPFQVESTTVYDTLHTTCDAINWHLNLEGLARDVGLPLKISDSSKNSRRRLNPLSGCVGALDGISVKIKKPTVNPAPFYCRKGFYFIPIQALVDSMYRFLSMSRICVGSANDALAHAVSDLAAFLRHDILRILFWIVGDEAYLCQEWLITPYPISQCGKDEKFQLFRILIPRSCRTGIWSVLDGVLFAITSTFQLTRMHALSVFL